MTTDFGRDIMFRDGDLVLDQEVEGVDLVAQECVVRLSTERGSAIDCPDDGFDLVDLLEDDMLPAARAAIGSKVRAELLRNEAVAAIQVKEISDPTDAELELSIRGQTSAGPFRLVLAVGDVTLEVLRG